MNEENTCEKKFENFYDMSKLCDICLNRGDEYNIIYTSISICQNQKYICNPPRCQICGNYLVKSKFSDGFCKIIFEDGNYGLAIKNFYGNENVEYKGKIYNCQSVQPSPPKPSPSKPEGGDNYFWWFVISGLIFLSIILYICKCKINTTTTMNCSHTRLRLIPGGNGWQECVDCGLNI